MTPRLILIRGIKLWLMLFMLFSIVHGLRGGDLPWAQDLAWAALTAAVVVLTQAWRARRGQACALCVDAKVQQRR